MRGFAIRLLCVALPSARRVPRSLPFRRVRRNAVDELLQCPVYRDPCLSVEVYVIEPPCGARMLENRSRLSLPSLLRERAARRRAGRGQSCRCSRSSADAAANHRLTFWVCQFFRRKIALDQRNQKIDSQPGSPVRASTRASVSVILLSLNPRQSKREIGCIWIDESSGVNHASEKVQSSV